MESLLAHFTFKKNLLESARKNGNLRGNPIIVENKLFNGVVFKKGDVIFVPPIQLPYNYTITLWFETPLPPNTYGFNSLFGFNKETNAEIPIIVHKNHLGVFSSKQGRKFIDSGLDLSQLNEGKHHLVAIGDSSKNKISFIIDNLHVGSCGFKFQGKIIQIGNNGTEFHGYHQPFGFVSDLRFYNNNLSSKEIRSIYEKNNHKYDSQSLFNIVIEDAENVIQIKNISKKFRIHHEKRNSVYEKVTSFFDRKKYYEELEVLKNVSFSVKKGEMLGIIGLNGSGKSTLLKLIAKILHPDEGTIGTKGKVIPILALGTGFQTELTAYDNVILYGMILGFTKNQIKSKLKSIFEFAELEKFIDTQLKNFSSGMYSRLAFSTAIQVDPDILLVDEVLSVGDLPFQEKSFNEFMKIRNSGKSIVLVSHDLETVRKLCDRVLILHEGKLHIIGKPNEVIEEYVRLTSKSNIS